MYHKRYYHWKNGPAHCLCQPLRHDTGALIIDIYDHTYHSSKIEVRQETTEAPGFVARKANSRNEVVAIKSGRIVMTGNKQMCKIDIKDTSHFIDKTK
ncbi:MAG: TATA-box binding protein (TBP) (component of TFIID and TFIIIB) [Gammaproteobacteria bacterium]